MDTLALVVAAATVIAALIAYMELRDRRNATSKIRTTEFAVRDHQIDKILPWFDEDREHDSLPSMVKDLVDHQEEWRSGIKDIRAGQDAFAQRLDAHLVSEEAEVAALRDEIHALRARIEEVG